MSEKTRVIIVGAGPAGLACAWKLVSSSPDVQITILEKDSRVGGLAKTLQYKKNRFDIGGHRFYTKLQDVNQLYLSIIGTQMKQRKRLSRIYFSRSYYQYPLQIADVLKKIGMVPSVRIVFSYIFRQLHRHPKELSFSQWVENRFGDALFSLFFRSYTEKVWGISTNELSADWAKQRIQNFSLPQAAINALTKKNTNKVKTIITQFLYPEKGPGQVYETMEALLKKKGVEIIKNALVVSIHTQQKKIRQISYVYKEQTHQLPVDALVSTMPYQQLVELLRPPRDVQNILAKLRFRHLLTVNFRVRGNPFPDNWIYIHDPSVSVGRIQNFRNWSRKMASRGISPISLEYFCHEDEEFWNLSDKKIMEFAKTEIAKIQLFDPAKIIDGFVYRVKDAYPIYTVDYQTPLSKAKAFTDTFQNLYPCGRGGLFRYNNMDHSIKTGFLVAEQLLRRQKNGVQWEFHDADYLEEE
jgi:protoporphyrinogen oxidase